MRGVWHIPIGILNGPQNGHHRAVRDFVFLVLHKRIRLSAFREARCSFVGMSDSIKMRIISRRINTLSEARTYWHDSNYLVVFWLSSDRKTNAVGWRQIVLINVLTLTKTRWSSKNTETSKQIYFNTKQTSCYVKLIF